MRGSQKEAAIVEEEEGLRFSSREGGKTMRGDSHGCERVEKRRKIVCNFNANPLQQGEVL